MSTLAAVVDWPDRPGPGPSDPETTAGRMVDCLRDRAPDGTAVVAAPGAGLAIGKLVVAHKQGHAAQPLVDREAGLYVVADVRIDNREDLKAELGLGRESTDAEVVLAGYRQWGAHVPEHLVGDFAFVVWDARERTLFAARDPFGVRPLVYRRLPGRILVASDVEQILEVDETAWVVDDRAVVEYLVGKWRSAEQTFFARVVVLPGGHCLLAREGRFDVVRWWRPPSDVEVIEDHEECYREFRRLLALAVRDRVDSDHPVVMQVSGGFDSQSIAVTAARVGARVPLRGISATYPGLDCDEKPFVEALKPFLPFPVEYWEGTDVVSSDLDDPVLVCPAGRGAFHDGSRAGLDIVAREGARVVLSGIGGDIWQPTMESSADYLREGRWSQFLAATLRPELSWKQRGRSLRRSARFFSPEAFVRKVLFWRPDARVPPAFLQNRMGDLLSLPARTHDCGDVLVGSANRARLRFLTMPMPLRAVEFQQLCTSGTRAELRFPFLDTRLLRLLWRLPLGIWGAPGYRARFHRQALADELPPETTLRQHKTVFQSAVDHRNAAVEPVMEAILNRSPWACDPYVVERVARPLLKTDRQLAWRVATLEAWLEMVYGRPANRGLEGVRTYGS